MDKENKQKHPEVGEDTKGKNVPGTKFPEEG